jgi:Holliday junction resolvase RusA-like endonuclease
VTTITFTVPGVPVAKGRARVGRVNGQPRMFTPAKTERYESTVALTARAAMGDRWPVDGQVLVSAEAVFPVPASWSGRKTARAIAGEIRPTGRPDLDNIGKALGDGCNGIVWTDDSRIVQMHLSKSYGAVPGLRVAVTWVGA